MVHELCERCGRRDAVRHPDGSASVGHQCGNPVPGPPSPPQTFPPDAVVFVSAPKASDADVHRMLRCDGCGGTRTLHPSGNFYECLPCHQRRRQLAATLDEIAVALNGWYAERKAAHEARADGWWKRQDSPYNGCDGERWTYAAEHIRRDEAETLEPIRVLMRKADAALALVDVQPKEAPHAKR